MIMMKKPNGKNGREDAALTGGAMRASSPTEDVEVRWREYGLPHQWRRSLARNDRAAGTAGVGRRGVGSESSAAGGRESEM